VIQDGVLDLEASLDNVVHVDDFNKEKERLDELSETLDTFMANGGGENGKDGVSATHSWNGTVLTVTSANGTSSADLKGPKGDTGA
jgi:hypothetical protein